MIRPAIASVLFLSPVAFAAGDFVLPQSIQSSAPAAFDVFGSDIAVHGGSLLFVGVRGADGQGVNAGAVEIFQRTTGSWSFLERPVATGLAVGDQLGESVAGNATWLVAGASRHDASGVDAGGAWVFKKGATNWAFAQKLVPAAGSAGAHFGASVGLSTNALAVGAPSASNGGSVVTYRIVSNAWAAFTTIANPSPTAGDRFGEAVAITDSWLAIGDPFDDTRAVDAGAVHMYVKTPLNWVYSTTLLPASTAQGQHFGQSLAISGTRLAVGAYGADTGAYESGRVDVFDIVGSVWTRTASINPTYPVTSGNFGWDVSIDGGTLAVGAPGSGAVPFAGEVELFARQSDATWLPLAIGGLAGAEAQDVFGASVATSSGQLVAAAPTAHPSNSYRGRLGAADLSADCDGNTIPDIFDLANGAPDCDNDGIQDACEPNDDGDALPDDCDGCPGDPAKTSPGICGCGSADTDSDLDGAADCLDECPNDPSKTVAGTCGCGVSDADTDSDGTPDCNDGCPSDPNKIAPGTCGCGVSDADTDSDGTPDCNDGCPSDPNKIAPGTCGCGVSDADTDSDGTADCNDGCPSDPNKIAPGTCGCGVSDADTDGDGTADCNDGCPSDPNKVAPGTCGCGVSDADTDGDGTADCNDGCPSDPNKVAPGTCGCGVSDADTDGDGTPDCNDLCPSDPNKTAPGTCGCGVADTDSDGDGIANCNDSCPNDPTNNCNSLDPTVALVAWGAGEIVGAEFPEYGQSMVPASVRSAVSIAGGWIHSLALQSNGSVVGWGANTNNLGTTVGQATPPASLGSCTAVGAGFYHSMALKSDGTVACWGDNRFGQSTTPPALGAAQAIAAGGYHSIAIRSNGLVACWGAGTVNSGTNPDAGQSIVPPALGVCQKIAGGGYHTLAVRSNGTVSAWGFNLFGQSSVPAGLGVCTDVAAGDTHSVALKTDGTVVCWGGGSSASGTFPQYGQSSVPSGLGACTSIAAGGYHTVAIRADGSVAAFGAGSTASTTDPNYGQSIVPSDLQIPFAATRIAAGGRHTLVLTTQRPVPSFYATIQSAIDACNPHDSVVVAAGTYAGQVDFHGKNIVVRGAGAASTILSGTGGAASSVVRLMSQEPAGAALEGFTIRGGETGSPVPGNESAFAGGGVFMYRSNATIRNCIVEENGAAFGAGLYLLYCGGSIDNCVIRNNSADAYGGGALLFDCTTAVVGTEFRGNSTVTSGGGLHVVQISTSNFAPTITGCTIADNFSSERAGGLGWDPGQAVLIITGSSITGNVAPLGAGGIHIGPSGGWIRTQLVDTDVCGNSAPNVIGSFYSDALSVVCDCPGDVDGNGLINGIDLAAVLAAWSTNGTAYPGSDVNHDGTVNGQDLAITLSNWGICN